MWGLVQSAKPSLHSNIFYGLLRTHVGLILSFQADRDACFTDVTSATITWDAVHTLLHLLGISNRSSFRQCLRMTCPPSSP
jgi:hypothetical protein